MKKSRMNIALLPILILIFVPIQGQSILQEGKLNSFNQLPYLRSTERTELKIPVKVEKQPNPFFSSSTEDKSQQKAGSQNTNAILSIKGITDYIDRAPIKILNDSAFGPTGYNFTGTGTDVDPYLITGYNITDYSEVLIQIENTKKDFKIENCYLDGNGSSFSGIFFNNATFGTIANNIICNTNAEAINLVDSHNNTVLTNTIYSCVDGIFLYSSDDNTIRDNKISENRVKTDTLHYGIFLAFANRTSIVNNTIHHLASAGGGNPPVGGIMQGESHNCDFYNNLVYSINSEWGLVVVESQGSNYTANTFHNITKVAFDLQQNSNFNTLSKNTIYNCSIGINLHISSNNNTLTKNRIYNNTNYGLKIESSSTNNTVNWNNFMNNNPTGTSQVYDSEPNNVIVYNYWDNHTSPDSNLDGFVDIPFLIEGGSNTDPSPRTYPYMYHAPIYIDDNTDFATYGFPGAGTQWNPYIISSYYFIESFDTILIYIVNTTVSFRITTNIMNGDSSTSNCMELENVTNGKIDGNIVYSTGEYGIYQNKSSFNIISDNIIHECESSGIFVDFSSSNNTCTNNTIYNITDGYGIYLESASNNTLCYNTIYDCEYGGILLWPSSSHNIVHDNNISICYWGAIRLQKAANNFIFNNYVYNCYYGIEMFESTNNVISNNTIGSCFLCLSIQLDSDYNEFLDNVVYEAVDGACVGVGFSNYNSFIGNIVYHGLNAYGFHLFNSDYTTISHNFIHDCDDGGIGLEDSSNNTINYNDIYNNTNIGLDINFLSGNNSVNRNNFVNNDVGVFSQAFDNGANNTFNLNYWDDWTSPDIIAPFGIVDDPYDIHPINGAPANQDPSPLTDPVGPIVTIVTPLAQDYRTDTINVRLDGYSLHYWYYIDGIHGDNQTWITSVDESLPDGTYTLHAYGNNSFGVIVHGSVTFTIDTTPPVITIDSPAAIVYSTGTITVDLSGESGTSFWYYIEGVDVANQTWNSVITQNLADGTYTLHAYGNDSVGNIGYASVIFTIDTYTTTIPETTTPETTTESTTTSKTGFLPDFASILIFLGIFIIYNRKRKRI